MKTQARLTARLTDGAKGLLREAVKVSWNLFKITVPIIILVKILKELGVVEYIGAALGPVMELVGLPGSMGLVWATAMVTNLHGAIAAFATLAPDAHLTVAQVTVLSTMMLVAHGLLVELRITQKAGPRLRAMGVLRVGAALLLGWALHQVYMWGDFLREPNEAIWTPAPSDPSWGGWAQDQAMNLLMIFLIILALLLLMKVLKRVGITALLTRILEPVLRALGMSAATAPMTIIGMTMGLNYGGGLILRETKAGHLKKRDIFFSLLLMNLSHALIEDTLLMAALGGHVSGILCGRLIFSLLVVFLLTKLLRRVPEAAFDRFFFRPAVREK